MFEAIKRFIDKLAKANEKEFKGQNPDCCTINRPEQRHNESSTHKHDD
jgi:hypothetical protein